MIIVWQDKKKLSCWDLLLTKKKNVPNAKKCLAYKAKVYALFFTNYFINIALHQSLDYLEKNEIWFKMNTMDLLICDYSNN